MKEIRLDKYLADLGIGTRSQVKQEIKKGKVYVNGHQAKKPELKIAAGTDEVCYNGQALAYEDLVYYMLNKPAGVVSATEDNQDKTVTDLLEAEGRKDLFPVGRLDKDTEGLLVLTNDGELAHRLLAPKKHVPKVYYARVRGIMTGEDQKKMEEGLRISEDFRALPAKLVLLSGESEGKIGESEILLTLYEGKFHQVKRMVSVCGKEVLSLKRVKMGGLNLDETLKPGEYRKLTEEELGLLSLGGSE